MTKRNIDQGGFMFRLFIILSVFSLTAFVGCSSSNKKNLEEREQEWGDSEFESGDDGRNPSSSGSLLLEEEDEYVVEKGDTLMKISFKLYGDINKWREIASLNPGSTDLITAGQKLKVFKSESPFVWQPNGLPYIIQTGDTLGTISNDKYGTPKKWKAIYENNKPLIKDANKIYAGFTIYYEEMESVTAL